MNNPCDKAFPWVPLFFLSCDLDLGVWPILLLKTLTFLITFEQSVPKFRYFTWIFPVIRPFRGYHYFLPFTLDFWTVSAKALIFHMIIPCDTTLPWFHHFSINIRAFTLHMIISCDKVFLLASKYLSLWPWPSLNLAMIGSICVSQTHLAIIFYLRNHVRIIS